MAGHRELESQAPLAARMRPRTLDEFLGQESLVGAGKALRRAIEAGNPGSMILYGPPGTGKTTLARLIAQGSRAHFEQLNAVTAGVADLRRVVGEAQERLRLYRVRTILFIDEIHRFNKTQQDALLPHVESGLVTLIGATTQNPYIDCIPALVSRVRVFQLNPLSDAGLRQLIERALTDGERGLARLSPAIEPEAADYLIRLADGDARAVLNGLESAVLNAEPDPSGRRAVTLPLAQEALQRRVARYDRDGDAHYDTISAFIKSVRGSDPDAAIHWLARMIHAGEDLRFIARRLVILAAEDIGNADPQALPLAVAAAQAAEMVGFPEARIPLAQATTYLACAPKSNAAYVAINEALADVEKGMGGAVPNHLRDSSYRGAEQMGRGAGYLYPHDFAGGKVDQQYLPDDLAGRCYYRPVASKTGTKA